MDAIDKFSSTSLSGDVDGGVKCYSGINIYQLKTINYSLAKKAQLFVSVLSVPPRVPALAGRVREKTAPAESSE